MRTEDFWNLIAASKAKSDQKDTCGDKWYAEDLQTRFLKLSAKFGESEAR